MKLSVMVDGASAPARYVSDVPIFTLGVEITLLGQVSNDGPSDHTIQDPRTSQRALLWFRARGGAQRIVFELNPSLVDATGEMTAPMTSDLTLAPNQSVDVPLRFWQFCADRCLIPGFYEVNLEHEGAMSDPLAFGVELTAESVPLLITMALDPSPDPSAEAWSRGQAMTLLARIPGAPKLSPKSPRETATEGAKREAANRELADRFLQKWPAHATTAPVIKFFADSALKL